MKAEDSRQVDTGEEGLTGNVGMALSGPETDVTTRLRTIVELGTTPVCSMNRRMRNRTSVGVGGRRGVTPPPAQR